MPGQHARRHATPPRSPRPSSPARSLRRPCGGRRRSSTRSIRARSPTPRATASGDLDGLRERLEHLQWLGVDAVWLSPIYRSPMADFGYDVADYCDIDPLFGDLAGFDALVAEAHARGIRVLLDWVPNHTSDRHPWFVESRAARDSPKRDWYRWRDGTGRRTASRPTTGRRRSAAARRGRGTRPPSSGTCTPSCPSSPTSTGTSPRSSRRCTTCCASGWTAASTASAPTSCTSSARTRRSSTSPRATSSAATSTSSAPTTSPARTRCCAASAACSTSTPGA